VGAAVRTVNQIAAYVLAFVLLAAGAFLISVVLVLPGPYTVTATDGQQFSFTALTTLEQLVAGAGGLTLFLAGLFLLALELLGPPVRQQLPLQTPGAGKSSVARASVEERLTAVLSGIAGVRQTALRVRLAAAGVAVDVDLMSDADVPLPLLCQQAQEGIARTLEHDLGLLPGDLRVRVRLAPRTIPDSAPAPAS